MSDFNSRIRSKPSEIAAKTPNPLSISRDVQRDMNDFPQRVLSENRPRPGKLNLRKCGGNEEKVKEKAPQAKKIAFWAPRRGAKTSKMKDKVMKIGQNLFRRQ